MREYNVEIYNTIDHIHYLCDVFLRFVCYCNYCSCIVQGFPFILHGNVIAL